MERRNRITRSEIAEACEMIRRTWPDSSTRIADTEKMLGTYMLTQAADDVEGLRYHLESLVRLRDEARKGIKAFKRAMYAIRTRIANAKSAVGWTKGNGDRAVTLDVLSETLDESEEDMIRIILRSLDKDTYYYLSGTRGAKCPLCGVKQQ